MEVVVRTYSGEGSSELFSLLEKHKDELEARLRLIDGFESYTLARSDAGDGWMSITICQNKAGVEESIRFAREWIVANGAHIQADGPRIMSGTATIYALKA